MQNIVVNYHFFKDGDYEYTYIRDRKFYKYFCKICNTQILRSYKTKSTTHYVCVKCQKERYIRNNEKRQQNIIEEISKKATVEFADKVNNIVKSDNDDKSKLRQIQELILVTMEGAE